MKYLVVLIVLFCAGCSGSLQVGVGGAYIPIVPQEKLTGQHQFHISVEHIAPITDNLELRTSWHHYSNGAQLGIGQLPNYGFDAIGTRFVFNVW